MREYQLEPITTLFVDGDPGQCCAIQMYAQTQSMVHVRAVLSCGQQALELMRNGVCPQVLVVDALVRNPGIFEMLRQVRQIPFERTPTILVTGVSRHDQTIEKMLTLGASHIILKPYRMQELFDTVLCWGTSTDHYTLYRVKEQFDRLMKELQVRRGTQGEQYLERILIHVVMDGLSGAGEEVYQRVAKEFDVSDNAVTSGVHRFNAAIAAAQTDAYRKMCIDNGRTPEGKLGEGELIFALAKRIRNVLRWS